MPFKGEFFASIPSKNLGGPGGGDHPPDPSTPGPLPHLGTDVPVAMTSMMHQDVLTSLGVCAVGIWDQISASHGFLPASQFTFKMLHNHVKPFLKSYPTFLLIKI